MNVTTMNALSRYFEALYILNQRLLTLCGTNSYDHMNVQGQYIDEVIMTLPRLIPYKFKKNSDEIRLVYEDGLLRFSDDIPFLRSGYEDVFQNHNDLLVDVKKVRNKLEHEMDNVRLVSSGSGPSATFSVIYNVDGIDINLCSNMLIALVKDLNILFSKIQELVQQTVFLTQFEVHPYYRHLTRYNFADFNKIYESDLLYIFGKAMLPF